MITPSYAINMLSICCLHTIKTCSICYKYATTDMLAIMQPTCPQFDLCPNAIAVNAIHALPMNSLCYQYAIYMLSTCYECTLHVNSLCHGQPAMRYQCEFNVVFICFEYALHMLLCSTLHKMTTCSRCAIYVLWACYLCAPDALSNSSTYYEYAVTYPVPRALNC